jgi:DNA-binding response OmpR family regulator
MQKEKILLIDDTADMLTIGQRIFERAGFDFCSARSGEEGLKKAREEKPSLIILDYLLPDMQGSQFIKTMAAESQYASIQDIPVVVLTAHPNSSQELDDCFKLGLRACLHKPFGHRELVNVVENVIRRARVEKEKTPAVQSAPAVDSRLLEDIRISTIAITSLCKELTMSDRSNLTDQQQTDLDAIYNSSRQLARLVNKSRQKTNPV